ncbi:MAG TPA: hypothetical protein DCS35_03385 [Vibrio sp.]|nr:hypothetical protein [Vibrio sp.]
MKHADAITMLYNGIVQRYQFDLMSMIENQMPQNTRVYLSQKHREHVSHQIEVLSSFAYDLGESDLAVFCLRTAAELGSDGVVPLPIAA